MASLLKFATKCAIGGGAVYVTLEEGVWSSSNQGSKALATVRTNVIPTAAEYFEKLKERADVRTSVATSWNFGVQKTFSALLAAPETVQIYSVKGYNYVRTSMER
ncbi:MICOS complex subunit MIC13-like [Lineus longissimus]|uniref:MICOS complex subunit MIC13-like n=1 Tax=Lineus longissimus TaxID=88925 RepID=UPI002B4D26D2